MKKIKLNLLLFTIVLLVTSCLKTGLDKLPAFSDANISKFNFEYRWFDATSNQLMVISMETNTAIDAGVNNANCTITVPAAGGNFTTAIRDKVALSNLVGYADISTAATMIPVGNSPKLGVPADFSTADMKYEISAADASTKKMWSLKIVAFIK